MWGQGIPCPRFVKQMEDKIEVMGAEVVYSNALYNPLRRPKISFKKPLLCLLAYAALLALLLFFLPAQMGALKWVVFAAAAVLAPFLVAKRAVIWLVHVYQRYASEKTRLKCVFEPSCSEYMILSVEKYGVFRGVWRGVRRLLRCHPPHGGVDLP